MSELDQIRVCRMTQWLSSLQQFSVVCKFHRSHQTMLQYLSNRRRKSSTHRSHHLLVSPHPRLPIPSPSSNHRYPLSIHHIKSLTKGLPKACPSLKLLVSVSSALTPFSTGNRKTGNRCPLPCSTPSYTPRGRAETTEGSGPLAMSANRTAIFLEFVFLFVEVWRNGKNDAAAMPADLG